MTTKVPEALRPYLKKRWLWTVSCVAAAVLLFTVAWNVECEKPVALRELPVRAQEFLSEHYPGEMPALAIRELDDLRITYEVTFRDGTNVKFRRNGQWQKIDSRVRPVPGAVVSPQIKSYAEYTFPGMEITEIEHEGGYYEVELANHVELTFDDKRFALRDYDD